MAFTQKCDYDKGDEEEKEKENNKRNRFKQK